MDKVYRTHEEIYDLFHTDQKLFKDLSCWKDLIVDSEFSVDSLLIGDKVVDTKTLRDVLNDQ